MTTDKNFSTVNNNDPRPPAEKQGASGNSPENARPSRAQIYTAVWSRFRRQDVLGSLGIPGVSGC